MCNKMVKFVNYPINILRFINIVKKLNKVGQKYIYQIPV